MTSNSLSTGRLLLLSSINWAPSSEFVSSSIPSWQILTAHAQPFRGARDLAFCLRVPIDSLLLWESSGGSGETVRMRRLAWTFAARIGDKYQIRLTLSNCEDYQPHLQCSNTHCQDTLSVQTLFNWLIGITCKFWGIIIKTLSWLSDNKQRTKAVNHCENDMKIAWFITSAFNT